MSKLLENVTHFEAIFYCLLCGVITFTVVMAVLYLEEVNQATPKKSNGVQQLVPAQQTIDGTTIKIEEV